jgi:hypothetical protein
MAGRGPERVRAGPPTRLAADALDQEAEMLPGFIIVNAADVGQAEAADLHGDVGDVPAEPVEIR